MSIRDREALDAMAVDWERDHDALVAERDRLRQQCAMLGDEVAVLRRLAELLAANYTGQVASLAQQALAEASMAAHEIGLAYEPDERSIFERASAPLGEEERP